MNHSDNNHSSAHLTGRTVSGKLIKHSVLERLMHYYHCLDTRQLWDSEWVTSSQIAYYFNMDDTQVRKDLALIGVGGRPRLGFRKDEVICAIYTALGLNKTFAGAIVGVGRLGGAILEYPGFLKYGLEIAALFDVDSAKIDNEIAGLKIHPVDAMPEIVRQEQVKVGILTCPADVSQECADRLIDSGIKAIWNFSTTNIVVPKDVFVRNEHISVGLAEIAYHMNGRISPK